MVIAVMVIAAAVLIYNKYNESRIQAEISDFNLPVMPVAEFNEEINAALGKDALTWNDKNSDGTFILPDGSIDIKELSGKKLKKYTIRSGKFYYFNNDFEAIYAPLAEELRREKIKKELELTYTEPQVTDIIVKLKGHPGVTDSEIATYRDGIKKLLEIAPIMQLLYQKQIGASPDDRIKAVTDDDRALYDRYGHPWCMSDMSDFCVALPNFKKRTSNVIPPDVSCADANKIGSPFEIVLKTDEGGLTSKPYNKVWSKELGEASEKLKEAAVIFEKIPREEKFAKYLNNEADAFLNFAPYPYAESDISWVNALTSDSLLFLRIGADEVGGGVGDNCGSRARFHFNIGVKNSGAKDVLDKVGAQAQKFEDLFAELVNDPKGYEARKVDVKVPVFLDVITSNGDDSGGPDGIHVAQTLPNWCGSDGLGKCINGTMVYTNLATMSYANDIMKKYIMPLLDPSLEKYYDENDVANFFVLHEIFHNIGPTFNTKKPGSDETYFGSLTTKDGNSWSLPLEELKSQTGALYMATVFYQDAVKKHDGGEVSDDEFARESEKYKKYMTYNTAWAIRKILAGSRSGPEFSSSSPYSRLATVQLGFLTEAGAINYNEETKQWSIDFDKMPAAVTSLMKKVGDIYVKANADEVQDFFLYYMKGDGEKLLHRDHIVKAAWAMPAAVPEYQIKGL